MGGGRSTGRFKSEGSRLGLTRKVREEMTLSPVLPYGGLGSLIHLPLLRPAPPQTKR